MNIKVNLIKDFMKKYGIKAYTLCSLCSLSRQSVKNVLNNSKNAKLHDLNKIAKLMEVDISNLIENEDIKNIKNDQK